MTGISPLGRRVIAALEERSLYWTGDPTQGATTGEVASIIGIRAASPQRRALNDELTALRKAGYLHFEFNPLFDREVRWARTRKDAP